MWSVLQERVYHTKISDVDELKRRIKKWVESWITLLLNVLLASGASVYMLAFVLEAYISSKWCKDDVTYYSVIFVNENENENYQKRKNNDSVNEN